MKEVWASFRLAFSMYSIFPARQIKKTRRNMKYILIFVPLVGAIIGFILKQWQVISPYLIDKDLHRAPSRRAHQMPYSLWNPGTRRDNTGK